MIGLYHRRDTVKRPVGGVYPNPELFKVQGFEEAGHSGAVAGIFSFVLAEFARTAIERP